MPCPAVLIGAVCCAALAAADAPNLAENAGFESAGDTGRPAGWHGRPDVYSCDTAVARSGDASLKFVNANADDYVLCSRPVALEHGRMYEVSAWVKTQGVAGDDSGATVCMEWSDAEGKYLGGHYPRGVKGDTDWTLVKGTTGRVPDTAAGCSVTCYVRKGMTGTAWWDDVCVRLVRERPLSTVLVAPNYRAEVCDGGPDTVAVRAFTNLRDYALTAEDVQVVWRVVAEKDGQTVVDGAVGCKGPEGMVLSTHAAQWAPDAYRFEVALVDQKSGARLAEDTHTVVRKSGTPKRRAYIDADNRLILDGEPFFPLGMYWSSIDEEQLEVYADSAFNCLMPYGAPTKEQMDLAHERGLKVIYSVKDAYFGTKWCPKDITSEEDELVFIKAKVDAFRDHPALMAWYINDELSLDMLERLSLHRQWLEELDPDHPTWVVLYQVDSVRDYAPTFHVIGTDPYPIPDSAPARAGEWTRKTVQAMAGRRPVWQVPQVFNWACYRKTDQEKQGLRPPTLDEMRSMAWQCIAEGANGLVFYSWFDVRRDPTTPFEEHWPDVKQMAAEIAEMIPVLLSVEPAPEVEIETAPWLHTLVKRLGDTTYVVLVNNAHEAHRTTFALGTKPSRVRDHGSGQPVEPDESGRVSVDLAPLAVRILEVQ